MGYSHGTKWSEEEIIKQLLVVKNTLNLSRMPSRNECELATGNCALSSVISRKYGWYNLADKLKLDIKDSETLFGKSVEKTVEKILKQHGFTIKKMSQNHPFDLLLNDSIKVDVKAGHIYHGKNGDYYSFSLGIKKYHTCDFFILVELNGLDEIADIMIVPSINVMGQNQISVGIDNSKYHQYINKFDCLHKAHSFWKSIVDCKENESNQY